MGKNKKKCILIISCLFVILLSIFLYPRKDDNKSIIKKSYAFKIKNNGETSYTSVDTIPSDLTNYHIDEEKTICENGGKVSIVGNKLAYQTLGSDRCSVYLYYEELHDIKINVANPSYLLGGYTKSITNCANASWDYKLNGIVVDSINGNTKCDLSLTPKTPNNEELLTTIVNNKATRNENGKRYQGKNPDNYIWFNDELWRIIGNIPVCLESGCSTTENRVKIIRNYSIGISGYGMTSLKWEYNNVRLLLNACYLGKASSCGNYCNGSMGSNSLGNCDYSSNGIDANDFYGKMIEDVYFNIGEANVDSTEETSTIFYNKEIATHTTETYKIGLMYASDFGYATENYNGVLGTQSLADKNWLFLYRYDWTMTVINNNNVYYISALSGCLKSSAATGDIRPALYLKPNVYVLSGTGTKQDPYIIGV